MYGTVNCANYDQSEVEYMTCDMLVVCHIVLYNILQSKSIWLVSAETGNVMSSQCLFACTQTSNIETMSALY